MQTKKEESIENVGSNQELDSTARNDVGECEPRSKTQAPLYVVAGGQRYEVIAWDPYGVDTPVGRFEGYKVTNVKCRGDGWKYLCPGDRPDCMRFRFLTSTYKPEHVGHPGNDSSKIRKKWKKWLKKRDQARDWYSIDFVPASDTSQDTGVVTEDETRSWTPEPVVKAPDYSDNLIYSKICSDTDVMVLLGLLKRKEREAKMLEANINMRLKLKYQVTAIGRDQMLRLADACSWMFNGLLSTLTLARDSILKAANFLDTTVADVMRVLSQAYGSATGLERTILDKKVKEIDDENAEALNERRLRRAERNEKEEVRQKKEELAKQPLRTFF